MSQYLNKFKGLHKGFFQRSRSLIQGGTWHLKKNKGKFKDNTEAFSHENNTASQVLERLSAFLKGAEGERHLKYIQTYIDEIVSILNIHLERIEKYYRLNDPNNAWAQENKIRSEQIFQQTIFKGEISIREKLNKLNIDNNYDNLEVTFHSERKASIPMKTSLEMYSFDIEEKIKNLDIDWNFIKDDNFYINYKDSEIPRYNPKKHFFDQDKDTLKFFVSEWNKIKRGLTIDEYFVHPWLYFHLNYFNTPIPITDEDGVKKEKVMLPYFRDNEWYFSEILKRGEERGDAGIIIYGSRRFSKSSIIASYLLWKATITPNGNVSVTGGNEKDLGDLTDKMETAIKAMHPAFRLQTNREDWSSEVEFGLKSKSNEKIKLSDARIINLAAGAKNSTQKTAGGAPVAFVIEEIGKFSWRAAFDTAIPSFETLEGWKTIPLLIGTGGETDMSIDAEKALANPEQNDLMEIDWDLLEWQIPKEAITWERRTFGWFVPAQMGYKKGFKRIKRKFSDFLQIKSTRLSEIEILQTDWINNTEVCKKRREKLKSDREKYQKEVVFYPLDPEECFMSAKNNPFPAQLAKKQKEKLVSEGDSFTGIGKAVELYREETTGEIKYTLSNKEIATYPHPGGYIDSPIILYEEIPDELPPPFTYILGLDDYRYAQSDGDSVGSATLYKRDLGVDKYCGTPVATFATRPDPQGYFHKQVHLLLEAFNAKCFPENADSQKLEEYFKRRGLDQVYLAEGFNVSTKFNFSNTGNRKYGWQPDKNTTPFVRSLVVDYCKKPIEIKDDQGNIIDTKYGIELIKDLELLEEIIKYKEGGNFDRIVSFGSALFYDYYLNAQKIFPRYKTQREKEEERKRLERLKKQQTPSNKIFAGKRRRTF